MDKGNHLHHEIWKQPESVAPGGLSRLNVCEAFRRVRSVGWKRLSERWRNIRPEERDDGRANYFHLGQQGFHAFGVVVKVTLPPECVSLSGPGFEDI
jgi:hypothetical protein